MKKSLNYLRITYLLILFTTTFSFSNGQTPDESQVLLPNQNVEREMTGKTTHRYKFDLKKDEFFQVRVEQKGVDILLQLSDTKSNLLAKMDGITGNKGFDALTYVAEDSGTFFLEVINSNEKIEKATYVIKRESSRTAQPKDVERVKIEKLFIEFVTTKTLGEALDLSVKQKSFFSEAKNKLNQALDIYRGIGSKENEKYFIELYIESGLTTEEATEYMKWMRFNAKRSEANIIGSYASIYRNLGEWEKGLDYTKQELRVFQDILSDKTFSNINIEGLNLENSFFILKMSEAVTLHRIGQMLSGNLGKREEGITYYNLSIDRFRKLYEEKQDIKFKLQEAAMLSSMATIYSAEARTRKRSYEYLYKALEIYKSLDSKKDIAQITGSIASAHLGDFEFETSLTKFEESSKLFEELDERLMQSLILNSISSIYLILNKKDKYLETIKRTLAILESPDFSDSYRKKLKEENLSESLIENITESNERFRFQLIASNYESLEEYKKAISNYEKALRISQNSKDTSGIISNFSSIGKNYFQLKNWEQALIFYKKALELSREFDTKEYYADKLQNVGVTLLESGKHREALIYLNEALIVLHSVGIGEEKLFSPNYSRVLNDLARLYDALGNRKLAIFYEKKAVNSMQAERQKLQNLDVTAQKGFLERNEKPYRRLADWLFEAGRFAEAEEVLRMLKEEEFSRFVRRDPEEINKLSQRIDLDSKEKMAFEEYSKLADNLAKIGVEYEKIKKEKGAEKCRADARCQELDEQLKIANRVFTRFLTELEIEFKKIPKRNVRDEIDREKSRQANLQKWNAVSIYTLVGEERLRVFLTTSRVQTDRKKEIKPKELNKKIADFRKALTDPNVDPRPLGKELYDILIAPIEKQIKDSGAKTLLFSLDGTLRYIPIAALWDGEKYLVEKYQIVLLTSITREKLTDENQTDWKIFGGGVTEKSDVVEPERKSFGGLPSVKKELDSIIREDNSTGFFDGKKYINETFTRESLEDNLFDADFNVLHLATHFKLGRDDKTSFLLLGNNKTLTLDEISNSNIRFGSIDLVVLSACETAFGNANNSNEGGEVDSSAAFFEVKGAKSIIASLWSVADNSTSELMIAFYQIRRENPKLSKSEALKLAQIKLLNGRYKTNETPAWRGTKLAGTKTNQSPTFKTDENAPFAHPYYWSPFILIGNWR